MTTFKKIDWLRQLYHEATKWRHSLAGQVPWSKLEEKDPNNGSKFTVTDLESRLPCVLDLCLNHQQVPFEFLPEVKRCLAYIKKEERYDCKVISNLVQARKEAVSLTEIFGSFSKLTAEEKTLIIEKIEDSDLNNLHHVVKKLRIMVQTEESSDGSGGLIVEEKVKQFKLIDWLRHIYLMCQKWVNNKKHGQLHWKDLKAKDPNNSKEGSRMKLEELKESLKTLAPQCLKMEVVPKPYLAELYEIETTLSNPGLTFITKTLEAKESLRKVAVKLVDALLNLEDKTEEVLRTVEPSKLRNICKEVTYLEKMFGHYPGSSIETNENRDLEFDEMDLEDVLVEEQPNTPEEEPVIFSEGHANDGTDILLEIMEHASATPTEANPLLMDDPSSPSSGSEVLSEIFSPISPDRRSFDEHFSDDSGIYSPEANPLGIEDPEVLSDVNIDTFLPTLDFSELPDVITSDIEDDLFNPNPYSSNFSSYGNTRKRKLEDDDCNVTLFKKGRP